jgi:hypothetical protein
MKRLRLAQSGQEALMQLGAGSVAPWRRAVARLLSIPVASASSKHKAA